MKYRVSIKIARDGHGTRNWTHMGGIHESSSAALALANVLADLDEEMEKDGDDLNAEIQAMVERVE